MHASPHPHTNLHLAEILIRKVAKHIELCSSGDVLLINIGQPICEYTNALELRIGRKS